MDRTERLLDLIALFLDAKEPVSPAELREVFPDYGQCSKEAFERKFERDKSELAELGVNLDYQPPGNEELGGYRLRDGYYLPEVSFTPEELAVLFAAGSAALASGAFPGRADLGHALRKIAFGAPGGPVGGSPHLFAELGKATAEAGARLETLWGALLARKRVRLSYRALGRDEQTEREVDPWGMCLRRGVWILVGYCHLRQAERTFLVERIARVRVNDERLKSPDFEVPASFRISEVAAEQAWEHRFHPPVEVELQLSAELAPLASRLFPKAAVEAAGEGARVKVVATYLDALLRRVLPLGEGAKVLGSARALARFREMAEAVARHHAQPEEPR
ncbi:MAG TPA: WYL domain-containing protein [Myxococcales bacterium]|nr:WYL domain-containing protein [Myxococcales bacterium]